MGLRPEMFGVSLKDFLSSKDHAKGTDEYEQFMVQLDQQIESSKRGLQEERSNLKFKLSTLGDDEEEHDKENALSEDQKREGQEELESEMQVLFDDIRDTIVEGGLRGRRTRGKKRRKRKKEMTVKMRT